MKQLMMLMFLSALLLCSCAGNKPEVPEQVLSTFAQMFPGATEMEWEMEDEGNWEVEFEVKDKEFTACFTAAGKWLETEWEVSSDEIPENVMRVMELVFILIFIAYF